MRQRSNVLWYVLLAVLALSLGAVYYHFKDYFKPQAAQTLAWDAACDLRSAACSLPLPGGGMATFGISPQNIPLLEPLTLEVTVSGMPVQAVEVDFTGVSMNMGYNRSQLQALGKGRYSGNIILPVCVRKRMDWEAAVMLKTDAGTIVAPFRFETIKGG